MPRKPAHTEPATAPETRGRKPLAPATPQGPEFVPAMPPAIAAGLEAMRGAQAAYGEERDLVNQILGQAQMASAFEQFSRTVRTSKLAHIKENKLYRVLRGQKSPHGAEILDGTWEEFCGLLGSSVDQIDRDIANLKTFGEEALESMSRMGIGYRELRQYRRLPEDEKTALIEVAKSGDQESFLDLAESLIARHAAEKDASRKRIEDLEATVQVKERQIKAKDTKINELDEALSRGKPAAGFAEGEALEALDRAAFEAVTAVHATLRQAALAVLDGRETLAVSRTARQALAAALGRVVMAVRDLAADLYVAPDEATAVQADDPLDAIWEATLAEMSGAPEGHTDAAA